MRPLKPHICRILLCLLLFLSPTLAQTPTPEASPQLDNLTDLRERLDEVNRKLQEAPPPPLSLDKDDPDKPPPYVDSLRRYDVSLRRLITLEESRFRHEQKLEEVNQELERVTTDGLDEPKPYSVKLLDDLQAQHDIIVEKSHSAEMARNAAKTTRDLENEQLNNLKALRRRLLDKKAGGDESLELRRAIENAEVAIEASETSVELGKVEMDIADLEKQITGKQAELLNLKLALVQASFRFSVQTLNTQLEDLENARKSLTEKLADYQEAESVSLERLTALQTDEIDDAEQEREIAARQEWVLTHQRRERLLEERLEFNVLRRDLWERRYLAHSGQATKNYKEWADSTNGLLVRLSKNREVLNSELSQIRAQLSERLDVVETDEQATDEWVQVHAQALINRQKAIEETIAYQLETESLAKRLLAEFDQHEHEISFQERMSQAWDSLVNFWNIELYTMGDSSVTVGKLSIAFTILILGFVFVGRFTAFFSRKFLAVLPIRENVRDNLERLFRYLLTLLLFLFALHVVNIPLTIFTFLGGTLAIAVGFGAQNILNNFISGLILMVERPVRTGDLIQVDDILGTVEEIGARSTRVRVPTGIHVILPNSSLLENKVVNWTLQDKRIRAKVSVGVAYGAPTREVTELMTEACNKEDLVLRYPAPVVTFDDFGDSSLNFTAHFWVSVNSPMDRDIVSTAVRHNINEALAAEGIEIPFPQRDVNINKPVPVMIVSPEEESDNDPDE